MMVASELINRIQELGYCFELVGDNIKFVYTKSSQPPKEVIPVLQKVKECKQEVVEYLRSKLSQGQGAINRIKNYELAERMAIMGENTEPTQAQPFVTENGVLVIPFNSDRRFHYWKPGGQSVCITLRELGRCDLIQKYKSIYN